MVYMEKLKMKSTIFLHSYHRKNTRKIANAIVTKINASIMEIDQKK
jgi:hypothetical protein